MNVNSTHVAITVNTLRTRLRPVPGGEARPARYRRAARQASRLLKRYPPAPTRTTAQIAVTRNCGHADHRCGLDGPTVTESTRPAASGKNRMMSQRQVSGRSWMMIESTNIRPMAEVIAPAVCLMIAPRPKAISATTVTNTAVPITAASTVPDEIVRVPWNVTTGGPLPPAGGCVKALAGTLVEWNSDALTPEPDIAACPTKNETNEVTSETISATVVRTISFAR